MCQAFYLFLLVCEKTHPKDGQWKIFVVASDVNTSQEKYFEFRKSLTHFDALTSDDHFGRISLKSGKSRYPINSFKVGKLRKNKSRVFALKHFQSFRTSLRYLLTRSRHRPIKHNKAFP